MTKQTTLAIAATLLMGVLPLYAQTATTATKAKARTTARKKVRKPKETAEQQAIRELQEKSAAQQSQIDSLTRQLSDRDAALSDAQSQAAAAQSQAASATAQAQSANAAAQSQEEQVNGLKSTVTDLQNANAGLATTVAATKTELKDEIESPTAVHYKGLTIQPVAFFAFEGVWRERSVNSDINTPFNSIPFPGANEGHTSELNFSGRQSRLGALFTGDAGKYQLTGYAEMDFLGTGTSSNNNQSNSYVLRQRQIWGQLATQSGFAVTGGQMWSLVTENRRGADAHTSIQPQTIDPQYMVGYSWVRQPEIRVQQRWGDYKTNAFSAALSVEQAQITGYTAAGPIPTNYFFGGLGQNGGLYNAAASNGGSNNITAYANNVAPDLIVKFAYDNPYLHFEFGGLGRWLRDQYFPVTSYGVSSTSATTPAYTYGSTYSTHTSSAGGAFGSIRGYVGKPGSYPAVEIAVQAMGGTGVGRYGSAQLADATLRPDETLEPIRNYHGLFSLESHWSPKFDVFAYYGGEYAQRTVYTVPGGSGALIGYGPQNLNNSGCYSLPAGPGSGNTGFQGSLSASNCASPTKYIQEGMVGFQYRPIVSPKYGKLQYSVTYQIIQRDLWSGIGSATTPASPRAQDSMIHVQMRYYIP